MYPDEGKNQKAGKCVFFLFLSLILLSLCTGCSFIRVKKDTEFIHNSSILVGQVSSNRADKAPVIVVAYSKKGYEREIAHYTYLHEPGFFELMVPKGTYLIFAFEDKNGNMVYDKGEPAGQFGKPDTVSAPAGGIVLYLDLQISDRGNTEIDFPVGLKIAERKPEKMHSTLAGAIADLDNKVFSQEYGKRGYWAGVDFFREVGGNIYFLEKYEGL
jgi:hypothetical protein